MPSIAMFDVVSKMVDGHKPRPNHARPLCLKFFFWENIGMYILPIHFNFVCLIAASLILSLGTSEARRQLKMAMKRGKGKTSITKVCYG